MTDKDWRRARAEIERHLERTKNDYGHLELFFRDCLTRIDQLEAENQRLRESIETYFQISAAPKGTLATVNDPSYILEQALKESE
jgi:chromosome segregation ATPase